MERVELDDIQGVLVDGYHDRPWGLYLLLRLRPGMVVQARQWLERRRAWACSAATDRRAIDPARPILAFAFTHAGLRAFGLSDQALASFVPEFQQGMDDQRRSRVLGDTGNNAPANWVWGSGPRTCHLLVAAFGTAKLSADLVLDGLASAGRIFELVHDVAAELRPVEPFGFRDGISQPEVEAFASPDRPEPPAWNRVPAGEFVLGYPNVLRVESASPRLRPGEDHTGLLPSWRDGCSDFGRNGSFMVVRELDQDVKRFAALTDLQQAKLIGRWKSGAPLTLSPERDDPLLATRNDHRYYERDRAGLRCPFGAHARRAFPRDGFADPDLGLTPDQAIAQANEHRLLRRGRPYWRACDEHGYARDGSFFICFNTNIERQFEYVQQIWLGGQDVGRSDHELDISLGIPTRLTVPERGLSPRLTLEQLVRVRGGAYFFLPGLKALAFLSRDRPALPLPQAHGGNGSGGRGGNGSSVPVQYQDDGGGVRRPVDGADSAIPYLHDSDGSRVPAMP